MLNALRQISIRTVWRGLRRNPVFALTIVGILAVGFGANIVVGSTIYQLFLEPLPYPDAEHIAIIWRSAPGSEILVAPGRADIQRWRHSAVVERVENIAGAEFTVVRNSEPDLVAGARISVGLAPMLGVSPLIGRLFTPSDTTPGSVPVALVSTRYWREWYGGSSDVLGASLRLNDQDYTIVGVVPGDFDRYLTFGESRDVWLLDGGSSGPPTIPGLTIARLKAGVDDGLVQRELASREGVSSSARPRDGAPNRILLRRPREVTTNSVRVRGAMAVTGITALLLLAISLGSATNLLLVRNFDRARGFAIRLALGARGGSILAEGALETILLAFGGGIAGIVLASLAQGALSDVAPRSLAVLGFRSVTGPQIAVIIAASLVMGALVSIIPAMKLRGQSLSDVLRSSAAAHSQSRWSSKLRSTLTVLSVVIAVAIAHSAGILLLYVNQLRDSALNFGTNHVYTFELRLPRSRYKTAEDRQRVATRVLEDLRHDAGFSRVTLSTHQPPGLGLKLGELVIEGRYLDSTSSPREVASLSVSNDYFRSLGVDILRGRDFVQHESDRNVVIVNETMAKRFWLEGTAIGARIRQKGPDDDWYTIIGVVADLESPSAGATGYEKFQLYFPLRGVGSRVSLLLKSDEPARAIATRVHRFLSNIDPQFPRPEIIPLDELVDQSIARERFAMLILVMCGAVGVLLSGLGVYSVVSFATAQRRKEIGIRLALGASKFSIRRLVIGQISRLAAVGIGLGAFAAFGLAKLMSAQLPGIPPGSEKTFLAVSVFFVLVALTAAWLPARRAARLDPALMVRSEN